MFLYYLELLHKFTVKELYNMVHKLKQYLIKLTTHKREHQLRVMVVLTTISVTLKVVSI